MTTAMVSSNGADIIENVMLAGDLSKLQPAQRVSYYRAVCESLHLNPLTKPFEYLTLNGKLVMYATRNCTDQLRKTHGVSIRIVSRERLEDIYVVTAQATLADGRTDESIGAVPIANLKGEALANALMKAETKAKRRATLCIVGLSFADETEVDSIPSAQRVSVNIETGEVMDPPQTTQTVVSTNGNLASDKQIGMIKGITRKAGWDEPGVLKWAEPTIGLVESFSQLTKQQASDLITVLKEAETDETGPQDQAAGTNPDWHKE